MVICIVKICAFIGCAIYTLAWFILEYMKGRAEDADYSEVETK